MSLQHSSFEKGTCVEKFEQIWPCAQLGSGPHSSGPDYFQLAYYAPVNTASQLEGLPHKSQNSGFCSSVHERDNDRTETQQLERGCPG